MITINNLTVTYSSGHQALQNVSLDIQANRITGVVGMNGAGKSTLFKAIMGFAMPSQGVVEVQGKSIIQALKNYQVAYVPQSDQIDWDFPLLVEEVVMMGRYAHMGWLKHPSKVDRQSVYKSLQKVALSDLAKRQIGELSGGQKKRMFVARALAQQSPIILMDEPFSGLDMDTEYALIELFKQLVSEGRTMLVSTHNLGSVPNFCDDVVLLNNRLIASGSVETVFTQHNLAQAFGGMLRHLKLTNQALHDDQDKRAVTVLSDDERPLVLYGQKHQQKIVN